MQREENSIKIAKINSRQAIIGAAIVGFVSIITTLISTGHLLPKPSVGTAGGTEETLQMSTALDAPQLAFSTKKIKLTLNQCMDNAKEALRNSKYSGMEFRRYFAWAYNGTTTALIWCHTDEELVIYIGAGKDWTSTNDSAELLRRLFRPE